MEFLSMFSMHSTSVSDPDLVTGFGSRKATCSPDIDSTESITWENQFSVVELILGSGEVGTENEVDSSFNN
jgi:hypothetical protein